MHSVLSDLVFSEARHAIHQAINRCCVRRVEVVNGQTQARPCNVYVWHRDARLEEALRPVLRGCPSWVPWRQPGETLTESDIAMRIKSTLNEVKAQGRTEISLRKVKQRAAPLAASATWARGRDRALEMLNEWIQVRSSLVLLPFAS
jgi:hypothetical protein